MTARTEILVAFPFLVIAVYCIVRAVVEIAMWVVRRLR